MLARTIWGEARSEPFVAQAGIVWSIKNRLALPKKYGATLQEVCLRPGQYDCWHPATPNSPNWIDWLATINASGPKYESLRISVQAAWNSENDPTDGATHYYTDTIKPPYWVAVSTFTVRLGRELFYKGVP